MDAPALRHEKANVCLAQAL